MSSVNAWSTPKAGDRTDNPQKYVLSHTEDATQGLTQFDCTKCSFMRDLVFISSTTECGNSGCNYFVFRKKGEDYEYVTPVFLHPDSFQFLKSAHHGLNDFISYSRLSAFEGSLATYQFDGKEYKRSGKVQNIKAQDVEKYFKAEHAQRIWYSKDLKRI